MQTNDERDLYYEFFDPENPAHVSRTVPDQTFTMNELITRFTRGQDVAIFDPVGYEDVSEIDLDAPEVDKMSKMDKIAYAKELKDSVNAKKSKVIERDMEIKKQVEEYDRAAEHVKDVDPRVDAAVSKDTE